MPEFIDSVEVLPLNTPPHRYNARRPLSALGERMVANLPPFLRDSGDYLAVIHCQAREFDRLAAAIEQVRAQFNPGSADVLLRAWERQVRLPVGGRGASIEQRQLRIQQRLRKLMGSSEGREWEERITELIGQGWDYTEHVPGDETSPSASTLRIALPFPPESERTLEALREIRELTPAHLEIEFASGAGFLLDESHLDLEGLGA